MTRPFHTVTLHVPAPQLPVFCTRLTTYLLYNRYAFLQTCHNVTQSDFDILHQQQPLLRLTLRSADMPGSPPNPSLPTLPPALPAEAVAILQYLLQAGAAPEDSVA